MLVIRRSQGGQEELKVVGAIAPEYHMPNYPAKHALT
jgi:hypothetical protein